MGATDFSALEANAPFLLWKQGDVANKDDDEARDDEAVARWLRALPCPVLAIAGKARGNSTLIGASDAIVPDLAAAAPLIDNIRRSPIAATVLVQLLRASATLSVADALVAESLAYSTLQAGPELRRWLDARGPQPAPAAQAEGPALLLERERDRLSICLNRPARRNAMSVEMRDALVEALRLALADREILRVEISGRGECFSSGGDLDEFGTTPDPATAHIVRSLSVPGAWLARCADRVTARLHGACVGSGIEFPAFAGRVIAAPDTWFQLPELRYGLIPGAGGCVSIPRRIGRQRTAWLALSGARLDAQTALDWGLIDAIE